MTFTYRTAFWSYLTVLKLGVYAKNITLVAGKSAETKDNQ